MSTKTLRIFILVPIYLIRLSTGLLGLSWLLAPAPWLLDQTANETLLQTTFQQLLAADVNRHLGDYLTGLYRFFGWWILSIGMLIILYAHATRLDTLRVRNYAYLVLSVILGGVYFLQLKFTPGTPFLWSSHGFALMLVISFVASIRRVSNKMIQPEETLP